MLCGLLISVWNWQINNNYMEFQMMKILRKKIWNSARYIQSRPNMTIYHIQLHSTKSISTIAVIRHFCSYIEVFNVQSSVVGCLIIIIMIKTMSQWANNWHLINDFICSYYSILPTRFLRMGSWASWSAWKLLFPSVCVCLSLFLSLSFLRCIVKKLPQINFCLILMHSICVYLCT